MRLSGTVSAENGDSLAERKVQVEWLGQTDQLKALARHGTFAGTTAPQAHRYFLLRGPRLRRPLFLETGEPGLCRLVSGCHGGAHSCLDPERSDHVDQTAVFVVPPSSKFVNPPKPRLASLVIVTEPTAVYPGRTVLNRYETASGGGEKLAVVGNEKDGLCRLLETTLQPEFTRDVEIVVRLVQEQHIVRPPKERFQHQALLLTARKIANRTVLAAIERHPERGHGACIPQNLGVITTGVTPVHQRLRVCRRRHVVLVLDHDKLSAFNGLPRGTQIWAGDRNKESPDRDVVTNRSDELGHDADRPAVNSVSGRRAEFTSEDAHQGRLTRAVWSDQTRDFSLADSERDVVQQVGAVRQHVCEVRDFKMAHGDQPAPSHKRDQDLAASRSAQVRSSCTRTQTDSTDIHDRLDAA